MKFQIGKYMLNRIREPFSKIEYETKYSNLSIDELKKIIIQSDSRIEEAKIELILRAINGEKSLEQEALSICDTMLRFKKHNFCYLARAMLGSPHAEQDLISACHTNSPLGKNISAQAGYQLARYYFVFEKYIESQAWLIYSIINGYEKAEVDFLCRACAKSDGFFSIKNEKILFQLTHPETNFKEPTFLEKLNNEVNYSSCIAMVNSMITIIVLAGKKFNYLNNLRLNDGSCWYRNANSTFTDTLTWMGFKYFYLFPYISDTNFPALALQNSDTFLHKIANDALRLNTVLFFELITYCVKNNILSMDIYKNAINFLSNYSTYQNKLSLQKKGEEILLTLAQKELVIAKPASSPNTYLYLMSELSSPLSSPISVENSFFENEFPPVPSHPIKKIARTSIQLQPVYETPRAKLPSY
jgi:hypothetical protein